MKVRDIMVHPVISITKQAKLKDAARLMLKHHIGCVPVVGEKGELMGMITETDFMPRRRTLPFTDLRLPELFGHWLTKKGAEKIYQGVRNHKIEEIMSPYAFTVTENDSIGDVISKMLDKEIKHVPVVRGKVLVGIVTRHDVLRAILNRRKRRRKVRATKKYARG